MTALGARFRNGCAALSTLFAPQQGLQLVCNLKETPHKREQEAEGLTAQNSNAELADGDLALNGLSSFSYRTIAGLT